MWTSDKPLPSAVSSLLQVLASGRCRPLGALIQYIVPAFFRFYPLMSPGHRQLLTPARS
ncbi:hypothetical protein J6590_059928 [Homalodisca vitripennis]|nr:hypothetical protein J6590_059928 [Homalodisca vitripennis]